MRNDAHPFRIDPAFALWPEGLSRLQFFVIPRCPEVSRPFEFEGFAIFGSVRIVFSLTHELHTLVPLAEEPGVPNRRACAHLPRRYPQFDTSSVDYD